MTSRRSAEDLERDPSNVTGSNTSGLDSEDDPMSMEEQIGCVVLMSGCIGVTVIGNILVILSVFTYRPLRNVQNFYIVSLACADLAVALIVMPFHVVTFVLDDRWVFGEVFCNIWLTCDILTCTASILNLCGIAVDRYCAIHDPIAYSQRRTVSRVMVNLAVIWLVSAVISVPPLIGWNNRAGESLYDDEKQACKLTDDRGFVLYSASGSFYIPLCLMTFVYVKIFLATRARLRSRARAAATLSLTAPSGVAGSTHGSDQTDWNQPSVVERQHGSPDSSREEADNSEENTEGLRVGKYDDFACDGGSVGHSEGGQNQNVSREGEKEATPTSLLNSRKDVTVCNGLMNSPNGRQANSVNGSPRMGQADGKTDFVTNRIAALLEDNAPTAETNFKLKMPLKQHTLAIPSRNTNLDSAQACLVPSRISKNQSPRERTPTSSRKQYLEGKLTASSSENHCRERPVKQKRTLSERFDSAISPPGSRPRKEDSVYRKRTKFTGSQERESLSRDLKITLKSRSDRAATPVHRTASSSGVLARSSSQYLTVPMSPADPSPLLNTTKLGLRQTKSSDDSTRFKFSIMMRRISRDGRRPAPDGGGGLQRKDFWSEKQRISLAKERRVARTMAIIMAAFVFCWLPFFLMYVIFPFCKVCAENVDQRLVNFIVWLGYVNSTLNPIIYTIFNIDFRRAFAALLRGKRCPKTSSPGGSASNRR